jgi:hypothetical protein
MSCFLGWSAQFAGESQNAAVLAGASASGYRTRAMVRRVCSVTGT